MMKLEEALRYFQSTREVSLANLKDWKEKFEKNPKHALIWSAGAFTDAAWVAVCEIVLDWLESEDATDETVEKMAKWIEDQVIQRARFPQRSTSQASNLMHEEVTAQMAIASRTLTGKW